MPDIISVRFRSEGKQYYFDPQGETCRVGDGVIVETAAGKEYAVCVRGNFTLPEEELTAPLRPLLRLATPEDRAVVERNREKEKYAFKVCQEKILDHKLEMKLVNVECNFEGNKTLFFFTSDGRVDFRELVKDLAGIFRNRIELRQIGVRDEAKMVGGLGICGRPYCCNQFLDDFQPVSTKMAKVQSLSLNPTKISGSCGRLMCCLRYEQEAYEDLLKHVPKQGAFVETKDGYGTAVQVNLLRQTVKVKLDADGDDTLRTYKSNELCAVPGGRPKDGETPPSVLRYVPEEDEDDTAAEDEWAIPTLVIPEPVQSAPTTEAGTAERRGGRNRRGRRGGRGRDGEGRAKAEQGAPNGEKTERAERTGKGAQNRGRREQNAGKATVKPVKVEAKNTTEKPAAQNAQGGDKLAPDGQNKGGTRGGNRRRKYYHGKPKSKSAAPNKGE